MYDKPPCRLHADEVILRGLQAHLLQKKVVEPVRAAGARLARRRDGRGAPWMTDGSRKPAHNA